MGTAAFFKAGSRKYPVIQIIIFLFIVLISQQARAQSPFKGLENLFTLPANYVIKYTAVPPTIDGNIDKPIWQHAQWTSDFTDIEGDLRPKPPLTTNVKMLWDDSCLYIAARLNEPQVWATFKQHDQALYKENDFELFINPDGSTHNYYEVEINALNTIFDLFLPKPYRENGGPVSGWDVHGLRSAIKVEGTLNNPTDIDKGWTVEMAIPFKSIGMRFGHFAPKPGAIWRINFLRVEYDTKVEGDKNVKLKDDQGNDLPEHNWGWSAQGVINMHFPERWGYLQFSKDTVGTSFALPYAEEQKRYLWLVYYKQKMWYTMHHEYANSLKELDLKSSYNILNKFNNLRLEATKSQFAAFINIKNDNQTYTINQQGYIEAVKPLNNE